MARNQVVAQDLGRVSQPPEIDDPAEARPPGRRCEDLRDLAVAFGEGLPARHRMHQVIGDIDVIQRATRRVLVNQVALDKLHAGPPTAIQPPEVTGHATEAHTPGAQPPYQPAADVPGRARDQDMRSPSAVTGGFVHSFHSRHWAPAPQRVRTQLNVTPSATGDTRGEGPR